MTYGTSMCENKREKERRGWEKGGVWEKEAGMENQKDKGWERDEGELERKEDRAFTPLHDVKKLL